MWHYFLIFKVQYVALRNINLIIQKRPEILKHEMKVFFVKYNDPIYIKLEKLDIMIRFSCEIFLYPQISASQNSEKKQLKKLSTFPFSYFSFPPSFFLFYLRPFLFKSLSKRLDQGYICYGHPENFLLPLKIYSFLILPSFLQTFFCGHKGLY